MYKNIDKKTANKRLNYNSLINQKSSFESQINTYKMTLADLEDKYERLDSTYKIIEQILLDLYSRHDFNFDACVKQYNDDGFKWTGSNFDDFEVNINETVLSDYSNYTVSISEMLDEIAELKKQYNTQINDMCNSILFVENMANELSVKLTEYIKENGYEN